MSTSHAAETARDPNFICDCYDWVRSACAGEQFYKEHEGKRYCVLHFPGKEKAGDFKEALQRKINNKDFDFQYVWFPDSVRFSSFHFNKVADFRGATFREFANFEDVTFQAEARFTGCIFHAGAYFVRAEFRGSAHFSHVKFGGRATFDRANFSDYTFFGFAEFSGEVDFDEACFTGRVEFDHATFEDQVEFAGSEQYAAFSDTSSLDLQFARIKKPDCVVFRALTLRPFWFVNVDPRKFEFTNVGWHWRSTSKEIESLKSGWLSWPHRMLAIACRHLAVNAEENHRYEEASKFRYMAMDARRLEHWRGFDFRRLSWWYWLASGYGERVLQAAVVLLGILVVCAALYRQVGFARWEPRLASESDAATAKRDETGAPLKLSRALTYSAAVMTFQRPEPRPATTAAQTVVLLETILGPVQAALLALAIRRKFMR